VSTPIPTQQRVPPPQVLAALCLLGVEFALAILRVSLKTEWTRQPAAALNVVAILSLYSLWLYGLWRGLDWLRWVTVVLSVSSCVFAPRQLTRMADSTQVALSWLQICVAAPAVVLLILPRANRWYRYGLPA
jgi:hypothetical protein